MGWWGAYGAWQRLRVLHARYQCDGARPTGGLDHLHVGMVHVAQLPLKYIRCSKCANRRTRYKAEPYNFWSSTELLGTRGTS